MSSPEHEPETKADDRPRTRRDLIRSGGAAAVASVLSVLGLSTVASAKNGDAVRAGRKTTASQSTILESRRGPALFARASGGDDAVGLRGASGNKEGIGVLGEATADKGTGAGVQGTSDGPEATAGRFVAAAGGTAVEARSGQRQGVALRTKGKLQLTERSGINSVSGGAEFVIPVAGGLSGGSFVLATLQDHHPGVHVESATVLDQEQGLVIVRLNQALASPAKVGWIVLD